MTTDFSDPSLDIPDFPGSPFPATGREPLLDTEATSEHGSTGRTYRSFLVSGIRQEVDAVRKVYAVVGTGDPENRLKQYDSCRSVAWFVRHNVSGKIRVASSRCGMRWCPLCVKSKRFAISQSVQKWMSTIVQPKFLTLTLRHSEAPLTHQIDSLYKYFKELKRRPWFKSRVKGGVWFFQVKVSKTDGLFHPHIHILFSGRYLEHAKLSLLWKQITHGSDIVDIRAVKNAKKAVEYVARYASAPCRISDLDFDRAVEVVTALSNRRICGTFGTAKVVKLTPQKPDDTADWARLGNFSTILRGSQCNSFDDEIVRCWKSGAFCSVLPDVPPPKAEKQDETAHVDVVTHKQMLLEFYGKDSK